MVKERSYHMFDTSPHLKLDRIDIDTLRNGKGFMTATNSRQDLVMPRAHRRIFSQGGMRLNVKTEKCSFVNMTQRDPRPFSPKINENASVTYRTQMDKNGDGDIIVPFSPNRNTELKLRNISKEFGYPVCDIRKSFSGDHKVNFIKTNIRISARS
jgi:hypothetical protein